MRSGRVTLKPGEKVGEHITEKREELIIVLKRKASLVKAGKNYEINEGETFFIDEGIKHNILNKTNSVLEYVYVVTFFR